jgi:hypothetical protein
MRLMWKLALLLAIGVGTQYAILRWMPEIEEARFALRVYVAYLRGGTAADTDVMDLAVELRDRQYEQVARRVASAQAATRPTVARRDASIVDELESSLEPSAPEVHLASQ